jgi:hypothetical protein
MFIEVEDAIVAALQDAAEIEFLDDSIVVATQSDSKMNTLLLTGGITVMYGGSRKTTALAHGQRLVRNAVFVVSVGRKMMTEGKRLSQDIEDIAEVITRSRMAEVQLTWIDDRFARVLNGVGWHDITFQATLQAV